MANVRKSSRSINKLPYSALSPFIVIYRVYSEVFVTLTTAVSRQNIWDQFALNPKGDF